MRKASIALLVLLMSCVAAESFAGARGGLTVAGPGGARDTDTREAELPGNRPADTRSDRAEAPDGTIWAVWSQAEGRERGIALSRFDGQSWSAPEWVALSDQRVDLDPRIAFLGNGAPVVVWWHRGTRSDRTPRVLASYMTGSGWSEPRVLSDGAGWRPGIMAEGSLLTVAYDSPEGIVIRLFGFGMESSGVTDHPTPLPGRTVTPTDDEEDKGPPTVPGNPA